MESRKRSVSLQGCITCRGRKLKCDESRPACSRCIKSNLRCEGYEARLRWTFYNPNRSTRYHTIPRDRGEEHGRRLLYTERQRLAMSRQVAASVLLSSSQTSDLTSLSECELASDIEESSSSQCCFQIFRLRQPSQISDVSACSTRPPDDEATSCTEITLQGHSMSIVPNAQASTVQANQEDNWNDQFPPNVDDISIHSTSSQDTQSPGLSNSPTLLRTLSQASGDQDNYPLPINTHFLIDHYRNNMGNWFSPLHSSKHPWAVLHLPVALTTLSELRIWGKAKHARVAILHSLLSLSAFTLTGDETGHWREVALQNQAVANTKMKESLASEFDGPGKAKYKDMLLAFLALTSISVVSGQHKDARAYLLDAERLICARGLRKRPTSRKKQLLHHYYLFLRVIEESTHIYASPRSVSGNQELDESRASLQFPSIQTHSRWHRHALNALSGTSFESSLLSHDPSKPSVLMDIYGIPLSLFSLISRATHLASEKEACQGNEMEKRLASQLKQLENDICAWNFYTAPASDVDSHRLSSETFSKNGKMLQHIVQAMHGGLVLYFYRRCHNLNAMLLQSHVDKILQHLQAVEEERVMLQLYNTSLIWPGFFAAAEAQGEERRSEALAWLRSNAQRSGWGSFAAAADAVEELWRKQEEDDGLTWVELLRGRGTVLFLS